MAQLKDLIVNGVSRFIGDIYGNLKGNADTATLASKATAANTSTVTGSLAYYSNTTGTFSNLSSAGTYGYLLESGGSGMPPAWIEATNSKTGSTIVKRNSEGDFSARYLTADRMIFTSWLTTAGGSSVEVPYILKAPTTWDNSTSRQFEFPDESGILATSSLVFDAEARCVSLTGTQTITGTKTFSTNPLHIAEDNYICLDTTDADNSFGYRAHLKTGISSYADGFVINVFKDRLSDNTQTGAYAYTFDVNGNIWAGNVALDLTANRLIYNDSSTDILTTSKHYVDNTRLAINSSSTPTETLYVNGNANINGSLTLDTALSVANGGTGASSFTADSVIISGSTSTSALTTRSITNNPSNTAASASTNIPTMNTLYYTLAQINNADQTHATSVYAPTSAGTANSILYSGGTNTAPSWTTGHYVNNTKLAINSTSEPTENLYVNGTTRFAIGNSDTAGDKRFIIGSSGNRYLSFGGAGVQAYGSNDDASQLFLNYNGGTLSIGRSSTITCNTTIYGTVTASKRITGLALTLSSTDSAAHIQFSRTSYNYIWAPASAANSNTSDAQILIGGMYGTSTYPSTTVTTGNATATFTKNSVQPGTTGVIGLGTSSKAWKNLYVYGRYGLYFTGASSSYPNHYIWSATASYGRIVMGVQQSTASAANASLIIDANSIYPGISGTKTLGTLDNRWGALHLGADQATSSGYASMISMEATLDQGSYYAPSGTTTAVGLQGFINKQISTTIIVPEFSWQIKTNANGVNPAIMQFNSYNGFSTSGVISADYAEYCKSTVTEPGRCVKMSDDETFILSTARLERGCEIISDTYGMSIGQTAEHDTPIAVSGRVLAYPYEDREVFRSHIGWPVCSGPNGTVSLMTEEEEERYPSRIIGTVWGVPDYESWGTNGRAPVNGRVWIRVR